MRSSSVFSDSGTASNEASYAWRVASAVPAGFDGLNGAFNAARSRHEECFVEFSTYSNLATCVSSPFVDAAKRLDLVESAALAGFVFLPLVARRVAAAKRSYYVGAAVACVLLVTIAAFLGAPRNRAIAAVASAGVQAALVYFRDKMPWEYIALYVATTAGCGLAFAHIQLSGVDVASAAFPLRDVVEYVIVAAGLACAFALPLETSSEPFYAYDRALCAIFLRCVAHVVWGRPAADPFKKISTAATVRAYRALGVEGRVPPADARFPKVVELASQIQAARDAVDAAYAERGSDRSLRRTLRRDARKASRSGEPERTKAGTPVT